MRTFNSAPCDIGRLICCALFFAGGNVRAGASVDPAKVSEITTRSDCKYLKAYCEVAVHENAASVQMSRPDEGKPHDVFDYFDRELAEKQIPIDTPAARLRAAFTIAIAVGMNESSGNPTVGPYIKTDPEQAEAGLFQLSHNTLSSPPTSVWLSKLYDYYRTTSNACVTSVFMDGLHDRQEEPIGSGPPRDFQILMKACPALAVEYGIVELRIKANYYGTVIGTNPNGKPNKAQLLPACYRMLADLEALADCRH